MPEGVAGLRNLLAAAKILSELDPAGARPSIEGAGICLGRAQAASSSLPVCGSFAKRATSEDSRRGLSFVTLLLSGLGKSLKGKLTVARYGQITDVTHPFDIGKAPHQVPVGRGQLFLIAGPCVIESETHARMLADAIQRITSDLGVPYIFKASYDKANRTSIKSFRGPGLVEGCRILRPSGRVPGCPY